MINLAHDIVVINILQRIYLIINITCASLDPLYKFAQGNCGWLESCLVTMTTSGHLLWLPGDPDCGCVSMAVWLAGCM